MAAANVRDDVILRHFIWARGRDRSLRRKLFLENKSQCAGGVEHVQNSACACVVLQSQYETEWQETVTATLSRRADTVFCDAPTPRPPKAFRFEDRSEEFAIRDSIEIIQCAECKGSGKTCGVPGCTDTEHKTHEPCEGIGQFATWRVFKFRYYTRVRDEYVYPESLGNPSWRLRRAYKDWISTHGREIESFASADVQRQIPRLTPDAERVVETARDAERRLRTARTQEGTQSGTQELFVQPHRYLTPLVYAISRLSGRADHYFLLGDSNTAAVSPWPIFDSLKMLAWVALLVFSIF